MIPFTHLHVHSQYSLLDGKASIPELVDKAIGDGMRGIALTDHGNMFGIKEFYNYVNKRTPGNPMRRSSNLSSDARCMSPVKNDRPKGQERQWLPSDCACQE